MSSTVTNSFSSNTHFAILSKRNTEHSFTFVTLNNKNWKWQIHHRAFQATLKTCRFVKTHAFFPLDGRPFVASTFFHVILMDLTNTLAFIWNFDLPNEQTTKNGDRNAKSSKIITKDRSQANNFRSALEFFTAHVVMLFWNVAISSLFIHHGVKCVKIQWKAFGQTKINTNKRVRTFHCSLSCRTFCAPSKYICWWKQLSNQEFNVNPKLLNNHLCVKWMTLL